MTDDIWCAKCRQDKPKSAFWAKTLRKPPPRQCRECIAEWVQGKVKARCQCADCKWFSTHPPQERWRLQAIGIGRADRPLLVIAAEIARANGDTPPACNGAAWAYLALKYDERDGQCP
tara:strand:+ start:212 stop:565 length:354 start_codon:yes stop_codon:yes gene_type:complete